MTKKGRSSSYVDLISYRKNSWSTLSVGLNANQLEMLLCESIPLFSNDNDLIEMAKERYHGIAIRHRTESTWTPDELNEVVTVLNHFLSSAPSLPAPLVSRVHSQLGCLRLLQQKYDNAIQSFLKALWILTSTNDPSLEQIGLCLHRLGISHGRNGQYEEAVNLLTKAIAKYGSSSLSKDHPCVLGAREDLANYREHLTHSRMWSSLPQRQFASLTTQLDDHQTGLFSSARRVSH